MNRKKASMSFLVVAMLLCGSLVLPVRATPSDWSEPRPSIGTIYDETIGNSQTDDIASVGMGITIGQYSENDPAYGCDHLSLRVSASANTRMGIQYDVLEEDYIYDWCEVSEPTGITGDDSGTWLYLGFIFLYYGVEYERVWVCSNGFIALNKTSTNADPQSIPSMDEPNPVIAVFWRDLHFGEGSSITYGRDVYFDSRQYFVVSWNNVLDDSGTPQTFQVLIQNRPGGSDFHNIIFFQYENITKSYSTTVGTEDQVGNKGTAYDYNDLHNEACLKFDYFILGYRLEQLWIKLTKSDGYAAIQMLDTRTAGYNVELKDYTNPWWADYFKFAIKTTAKLLLWKASIAWKVMLIVADFAEVLANDLSPLKPEYIKSALEGDPEAWAYGDCVVENRIICKPFDSTLATTVEWLLTDSNDKDHDLTVTAEAWYRDLSNDNLYIINTSSTLNMYIPVVNVNLVVRVPQAPPEGVKVWVEDHGYTAYANTPVSATVEAGTHTVKVESYFFRNDWWVYTFDRWEDGSTDNPRSVPVNNDMTITAYYTEDYLCPTLFVWNGMEYVEEGLLDIHAESDVTLQHEIQSALALENGVYKLQLRELDDFTSHIDQVRLYAVDDEGEWHSCPLTYAYHSELGKVKYTLRFDDDSRVDLKPTEVIDLKFAQPECEPAYFIFEINGFNKKWNP